MKYLNDITFNLNRYIEKWENWKLRVNQAFPKYDILQNFKSLHAITNSRNSKLLYLGAYLLQVFLNAPQLHTERVLDTILASHQQDDNRIVGKTGKRMPPSKLLLVPPSTRMSNMTASEKLTQKNLNRVKEFLKKGMYSELGYPDGINITINSITTYDNVKEQLTTDDTVGEKHKLSSTQEPQMNKTRRVKSSPTGNRASGIYKKQNRKLDHKNNKRHKKSKKYIKKKAKRTRRYKQYKKSRSHNK